MRSRQGVLFQEMVRIRALSPSFTVKKEGSHGRSVGSVFPEGNKGFLRRSFLHNLNKKKKTNL